MPIGQLFPVMGPLKGYFMSINSIQSASNAWSLMSQTQSISKQKPAASSAPFTLPGIQAAATPKTAASSAASDLKSTVQSLASLSTGGVTGTLLNLFA